MMSTSHVDDWQDKVTIRPPLLVENLPQNEMETILGFIYEHFVPYEPLNQSINVCEPGYRMPWFDTLLRKYIRQGLTLVAHDKESHEMVGVAIFVRKDKSQDENDCTEVPNGKLPRWAEVPEKFAKILNFLNAVSSMVDIYEHYGTSQYTEFFILCTHSKVLAEIPFEDFRPDGELIFHKKEPHGIVKFMAKKSGFE